MNNIAIDKLVEQVESKYSLVIAVAKRARTLAEHSRPFIKSKSKKNVTVALEEIEAGKITYDRPD